jgi:hypothetical protein
MDMGLSERFWPGLPSLGNEHAFLPGWVVMWAMATAIYALCKFATWLCVDRSGVTAGRSVAYLCAWPGMNARAFLQGAKPSSESRPRPREWVWAAAKILFGIVLVWAAANSALVADSWLTAWLGMIGIVFVLHFGVFHLLSCCWRSTGIQAEPLMNWPIAATSVADFWGKRWNRAFHDLTHQFLFRPLTAHVGPAAALWSCFLASGIVHDLVISVPARGGFGEPTLFFLIQAGAIGIERSTLGRRMGLRHGIRGSLFAAVALVLPLPLLFHSPFIENVMIPFLRDLGVIFPKRFGV